MVRTSFSVWDQQLRGSLCGPSEIALTLAPGDEAIESVKAIPIYTSSRHRLAGACRVAIETLSRQLPDVNVRTHATC